MSEYCSLRCGDANRPCRCPTTFPFILNGPFGRVSGFVACIGLVPVGIACVNDSTEEAIHCVECADFSTKHKRHKSKT